MTIWWCEEHKASGDGVLACYPFLNRKPAVLCRMVEMRLVPLDDKP